MGEYRGKYEAEKKDPLKPWYPVIGLVLIAIAAAAGYFGRVPVYDFLSSRITMGNVPRETMEIVVALGIALVMIGIFSTVFAIFAPKPKDRKIVNESALKSQKDEMNRERQRAKRRKLQMQQKLKKRNKN